VQREGSIDRHEDSSNKVEVGHRQASGLPFSTGRIRSSRRSEREEQLERGVDSFQVVPRYNVRKWCGSGQYKLSDAKTVMRNRYSMQFFRPRRGHNVLTQILISSPLFLSNSSATLSSLRLVYKREIKNTSVRLVCCRKRASALKEDGGELTELLQLGLLLVVSGGTLEALDDCGSEREIQRMRRVTFKNH
jgi:hypothetical protein